VSQLFVQLAFNFSTVSLYVAYVDLIVHCTSICTCYGNCLSHAL